jgi:hypothetical protein
MSPLTSSRRKCISRRPLQFFAIVGEPLPVGPDWHYALLRRAARPLEGTRPAILSEALRGCADELLRFRHVAMHSYDQFDARKGVIAVEAAQRLRLIVDADIDKFRSAIDPD